MTVSFKAAVVDSALLLRSGAGAAPPGRALSFAALSTWLIDAASGVYMLSTWIARGGPRQQRTTGDRLAPAVVFAHFGLATTGLLLWLSYVVTGMRALALLATGLLMLVIGLGISTVTLWTPFPAPAAGPPTGPEAGDHAMDIIRARQVLLTDEVLSRALTDEVLLSKLVDDAVSKLPAASGQPERKPRRHMAALVPAGHGLAAIATFLLAVLTDVALR